MSGPWIKTVSGRQINFLEVDPSQILPYDIILVLSRNHRFGGHSPVKVLQHLLEVATLMIWKAREKNPDITQEELFEIVLVALLHDFPEYAVGDIPTPLKRLLGDTFVEIENRILDTMLTMWDLHDSYLKHLKLLKECDQIAVEQEALRFGLDGQWLSDDFTTIVKEPNAWVPQDTEIVLKTFTIDPLELFDLGIAVFFRAMWSTGRWALLPKATTDEFERLVADNGHTMEIVFANNDLTQSFWLDGRENGL